MNNHDIQQLAHRNGLLLTDEMTFNEMGIDFKVGFAKDTSGAEWILRVPRRTNIAEQIATEKRILQLASKFLSVQVPDWQIANAELVAYPLLDGKPVLTFDAKTYEVTWNMDKNSARYIPSLANRLVQLHAISEEEVRRHGLKIYSPEQARSEIAERLHLVKSELGISSVLESRYSKWLDDDALWPNFSKFIHGDLYAGHILTDIHGEVTGIIDWSTAHVSDIAQDFSGHLSVFGEQSLRELIDAYQRAGGEVWDTLFEQTVERAAAAALAYGYFAIESQDSTHLEAAKMQLHSS